MKTAFFVTSIENGWPSALKRCFGFFFTEKEAINAVLNNDCDIHECLYEYVVIEEINDGIHGGVVNEIWFEWNRKKSGWEKISKKPVFAKRICNWGIG